MSRIEPVGANHRAVCAAALVIGPEPVSRGALATKQSSFLCCLTKAGLLRCARNDGRGYRAVWPRLWSRLSEPRFRPVEPGDDNGGCGRRSQLVIPGHRGAMSPESITTTGSMDSGPAPRGASRNDETCNVAYDLITRPPIKTPAPSGATGNGQARDSRDHARPSRATRTPRIPCRPLRSAW